MLRRALHWGNVVARVKLTHPHRLKVRQLPLTGTEEIVRCGPIDFLEEPEAKGVPVFSLGRHPDCWKVRGCESLLLKMMSENYCNNYTRDDVSPIPGASRQSK
jgi:hypothetical protein